MRVEHARGWAIRWQGKAAVFVALVLIATTVVLSAREARVQAADEPSLQEQVAKGGDILLCHCTITLTETLVLQVDGTHLRGQDTTFVWKGPAKEPMVLVNGAMFTTLSRIRFVVGARTAAAGIEFRNAPGGPGGHPTFGNKVSQVRIGTRGTTSFDYGILVTGDVNGVSNTFENVQISGARTAGVGLLNPQAVANEFNGLWVFDSAVGFQARGEDTAGNRYGPFKLQGRNWGFGNSSVADLDIGPNAAVDVTGFYSEGSRRMVRSSGGGVTVRHGYWQRGVNAVNPGDGVARNENSGGYRSWIRLEDFDFTQTSGERIVGWPSAQQFLVNVAGAVAS